ncbi:Mitochondrial 2-oxodicarboxylate carrier [Microtus ochrogaster]|uniref:Mitochondrial 2-oxodicarboxylate carrier n=1 Tax=Microtus ochrogaster TaxID=79684 RepID=A0A8J6GVZ2_MICOH|nr:Mitochondrial 2-oxodicarboxylate carrier [Microtus ochrogaster]
MPAIEALSLTRFIDEANDHLNATILLSFSTVVGVGLFGFYKGILPPILAETPKCAVKTFAIAGLGTGVTEAIVINPFEVVKVGLQVNRNTFTKPLSTFAYARQIIKKEGLGIQGLNKGLTATLGRHGIFNMVYFGFYHNVKNIIPASTDPTLEFLRKFGIGFLSGTMGSVFNIPFDVAKTRIQGPQPVPGEIKYRNCFKTMATVYREEGILALYKGLVPKVMRLGPGVFTFDSPSRKGTGLPTLEREQQAARELKLENSSCCPSPTPTSVGT